jgi:hypothetical protein
VRGLAVADHRSMPNPLVTPASATVQEPSPSPDADDGGALMRSYLGEVPALTDPQRAAFTRQCTAEKADDLGRRTRAGNVLRDGERFATTIRGALAAPRGGLAYSKPRFRFYLEALLDLRDHVAKDGEQSLTQSDAAVGIAQAREAAVVARETLIERMNGFAAGDTARTASVAKAAGSTKDDNAILSALGALLKVARGWLKNADPTDQALAESVGVDTASLDELTTTRTGLADALAKYQGSGGKVYRDSPDTNRIEGRVLFEMRYAMTLFEGAHGRDALSPRLIPGPGTRHVLAPSRKGAAEEPAAGAGEPDAGAGEPDAGAGEGDGGKKDE